MGKKVKLGKQRKDKFYHLAKEAGYRSRAAFKLIQLNRKFEFLQRARVLVDLCAAPGGWLQVAQKCMPVSSVLIGVDLVPIKPISNCITVQEDITTPKCQQVLKKELKTWKVDVFLHDGAPNVGKSWVHDAFAQAQLTLHALKLATEFLVKGGWFITKVFRSKDYHALLWVFNKLFKKVHSTKPQASRHESAEIFVVCQHYIAPDKIDPKFLDPAYVFEDVERNKVEKPILGENEKKRPKAEGYPAGDYTLFHEVKASEFITSNNHVQLLNDNTKICVDTEEISNHPATTEEVRECCKDLKVLGKNELKTLLNWRKKLRPLLVKSSPRVDKEVTEVIETEDDVIERRILEAKAAEARESRIKKKKVAKERQKLRSKMDLKMNMGSDALMLEDDMELFKLGSLKSKQQLNLVQDQDADMVLSEDEANNSDNDIHHRKRHWVSFDKDDASRNWNAYDESGTDSDDSSRGDSDHLAISDEEQMDEEQKGDITENEKNPLIVNLEESKHHLADRWFGKEELVGLENDSDENLEVEMMADAFETSNRISENRQDDFDFQSLNADDAKNAKTKKVRFQADSNDEDSSDDDEAKVDKKPQDKSKKTKRKKIQLTPEGLALGTLMIHSAKTKRDIMDNSYNRYTNNDENLPDWFVKDEEKHNRKAIPVTAEMMKEYRDRLKEINARPIRKVLEAKARKNKRARRIMERARKKAEAVTESLDMTLAEKAQQVKSIYKKVSSRTKKEKDVTYVVAKKGTGRRVRRPPGVKGRFKVVDRRLKKDDHKRKAAEKMAAKKGKNRKQKNRNTKRSDKIPGKRGKK